MHEDFVEIIDRVQSKKTWELKTAEQFELKSGSTFNVMLHDKEELLKTPLEKVVYSSSTEQFERIRSLLRGIHEQNCLTRLDLFKLQTCLQTSANLRINSEARDQEDLDSSDEIKHFLATCVATTLDQCLSIESSNSLADTDVLFCVKLNIDG